jgi:polar amino acid transport system substrate-binding protein
METPWAMAVAPGEDKFAKLMSDMTKDWMKSGRIVALEKKWGLKPTDYSVRMHEKYKGS